MVSGASLTGRGEIHDCSIYTIVYSVLPDSGYVHHCPLMDMEQ